MPCKKMGRITWRIHDSNTEDNNSATLPSNDGVCMFKSVAKPQGHIYDI